MVILVPQVGRRSPSKRTQHNKSGGPTERVPPAFGGWTRAGDPQNSLGEAGRQLRAQRGVQEPRKGQSRGAHWAGRPVLGIRNGRVCEEGLQGSRRLLSTQPLEEQSWKRLWRGGDPGQRTRGSLVISSTPSTSSPTCTHLSEHLTHLNAHSPATPMTPRPHEGCTSPAP